MTRKDIPFISNTLRRVRDGYEQLWDKDPAMIRACDAHANRFADELEAEIGDSFDKKRFLRDAGVRS